MTIELRKIVAELEATVSALYNYAIVVSWFQLLMAAGQHSRL